jgi:hypothetical protein
VRPKEAVPNEPLAKDQLCSTCSTISFEGALFNYCDEHAPQNLQSQGVINLGTVQRVLDNTSCPACRLVSSCISSYGETILPAANLRILSRSYPFELREKAADPDSDSGPPTGVNDLKWLDIETCGHEIGPVNGKRLSLALQCEFVSIGVLIPAGPPYYCKEGETFSGRKDSRYIYARQVSPAVDIGLVRKWMAYCATHHTEICETRFVNLQARKDIRLIDVQQRQLVMGDLGFNYMALSYVWGPNTKPILTKSTLGQLLCPGGLAKEDIPLTIWDVMELVADLGERYLWVDSVCIIQDDLVDKQRELPMMGEIYNHAMLVIVAAVDNAHSGLPGRGEHKRQWSRPTENIQGLHFTTGQPELHYKLDTAIWNTRGWTFQEAQLARRALVFTEYQVYWNCRQEAWCEDRFTEFLDVRHIPFSHNSLFSLSKAAIGNEIFEGPHSIICPLWEYCQKVQAFSMRSLSNRDDTLWSFFGILKSLIPKFPKGYIWGMPKDYLDAALLWETDCSCEHRKPLVIPTEKGEWQELETPSWCWLSKGSKVWYNSCGDSVKSMVEWHEPLQYEEYIPMTDCRACQEVRERYLASLIFPADQDLTGTTTSHFARLHFSAQTAILRIHIPVKIGDIMSSGCFIALATVSLLSGKDIGSIRVPIRAFNSKLEMQGEFILLSSKAVDCESELDELPDEMEHFTGCKEPKYNIMLIRWSDKDKVAYRVAWTKIARSAWEECETQKKRIILG